MEGLLSLLIFAGLFYVMMRFGCGSHMVHGDHGSTNTEGPSHVDPVCGKPIDAAEGYGMMHKERLYRFCSRTCLDAFEADPDQYLVDQEVATS